MSDERWDSGPADEAPRDEKPHPFGTDAAAQFSTDANQSTATDLSNPDNDEFLQYMLRYKDQGEWKMPSR